MKNFGVIFAPIFGPSDYDAGFPFLCMTFGTEVEEYPVWIV